MGFFSSLKSLFNSETLGDEIINAQIQTYQGTAADHPDWEPHEILVNVWLTRMLLLGNDIRKPELREKAYIETRLFACLPPPKNACALGLWFIYKERPDIIEKHPKFNAAYATLMPPILEADKNGTFLDLFRRFNPRAARAMDEIARRHGENPF